MNCDDLPDEIVQPLLQFGRALVTHARAHRDTSLAEHEDGVLAAWRMVAPTLLESVLRLVTTGLEKTTRPLASRCPRCEQRRGVQSQRKRQVQTRLGPIRLKRWWHHCWKCGHGWSPPDQALGLAAYQQMSPGLVRWQAALGAVTTFREAANLLGDLAGVEVGSETLRTQAERIGTELEGQQRHLEQPSYVAAREPAAAFARRLGAEAARRGALDVVKWHPWDGTPAELRPVVVLGDGAKWIWEHVATLFGEERTEIVDWYHASEHIWTVAKAVHGDDTPETKAWANTALDHLWQTGPKPVLHWFDATQPGSSAAGAVVQRERGYFSTNAARMQYPSFRERQLPIGSGAVEASAKHLVQQRMKRAGSRWSDLGARAIAATSSMGVRSTTSLDFLQSSVRPAGSLGPARGGSLGATRDRTRFGERVPAVWRFWSLISGGQALGTNRNLVATRAFGAGLMTPSPRPLPSAAA